MAISFLQDDIHLTPEQWNTFSENVGNNEFDVAGLGDFSFVSEGSPEFDYLEKNLGVMIYVVENVEEEEFYLFRMHFYYSNYYEFDRREKDYTLEAISKSDSLNY